MQVSYLSSRKTVTFQISQQSSDTSDSFIWFTKRQFTYYLEMEILKTPIRNRQRLQEVHIPASPFMKKIGFGTGVAVYEMLRSPVCNKLSSPWAIKKLVQGKKTNLELDKRLMEEAKILGRLKHPNIVGFRAFTTDADGRSILAMEECTGCLGEMIEERCQWSQPCPYPVKTIIKVSSDVANALEYLHNDALLLHCDVKSYNVLVKGDFCICKLCDFGVCLPVTKTGAVDLNITEAEVEYVGTTAWCAPEILKYPQEISTKADIYAFGLVIWEMIALSPPVDNDFETSLSNLQIDTDSSGKSLNLSNVEQPLRTRPNLPDVDLGVDYNIVLEIYFCCTDDDKNKRPTAKDLTAILKEIENDNHC